MFGRVVDHMAPLAEGREIARPVARRVMVQVRARDRNARRSHQREEVVARHANPTPTAVAPAAAPRIPPAAIAQVRDRLAMRTIAMLAAPLGAVEPNEVRQLEPVDRIESAMFGTDRHDPSILESFSARTKGESGA